LSLQCLTSASADSATLELMDTLFEVQSPTALNLIDWKIGDEQTFSITAMFGMSGQMVKSVTREEGEAVWFRQAISLMGQNEVMDTLINRADGKVLKMLKNGQEQPLPTDDDKPEIISQDYGPVTVPAGTFQAIHIVAKTKKVSKLELWANPRDTVMEGTLKTVVNTGMMDITMQLTSFKHGT
jgi:hypothetical protein